MSWLLILLIAVLAPTVCRDPPHPSLLPGAFFLAPASPVRPGGAATDPAGAQPPLPPPPSAAETARLVSGEVLVASRPVAAPRALAEEVGRGIIDSPPERVFAAVVDFAHYQEWVPFVKRSDATPRGDGSVVSFQSLALPFPLGRRYYKIQARSGVSGEGAGRVSRAWWHYLPGTGNVADHYGWWVLVPYGEGRTLGTCVLYTDPGHMPAWAVHRGTAETMPYVFSGLRQQIRRSRYDRPYP